MYLGWRKCDPQQRQRRRFGNGDQRSPANQRLWRCNVLNNFSCGRRPGWSACFAHDRRLHWTHAGRIHSRFGSYFHRTRSCRTKSKFGVCFRLPWVYGIQPRRVSRLRWPRHVSHLCWPRRLVAPHSHQIFTVVRAAPFRRTGKIVPAPAHMNRSSGLNWHFQPQTRSRCRRILYLRWRRVHGLVLVLPGNLRDRHHRLPWLARTSARAIHSSIIGSKTSRFSPFPSRNQFNFLIFSRPSRSQLAAIAAPPPSTIHPLELFRIETNRRLRSHASLSPRPAP